MIKGNITKISNGHMNEVSKLDHISYAKTMQSNASGQINEKATDGVVFGKPEEMKFTTVDEIDIVIGVFFDGTLNNKYNTEHKDAGKGKGSYGNDYSNVARLFYSYKEKGYTVSTYIEGIGTEDGESDSTIGSGFGAGDTGIPAKVQKGCRNIVDTILKVANKRIGTLTIDVFGFSRGAAAARHFIYEVTKPSYAPTSNTSFSETKYDANGHETTLDEMPAGGELGKILLERKLKVNQIKIRFVGLFDTVSSFNKGGFSVSPDFSNDVGELHLNQLFKAEKVIHFTAADEHRKYFALTRIQSAGSKGIEKDFPGVHSDIGGSYPDGEEYVDEILMGYNDELVAEKNRLIAESWYKDEQLEVHSFLGKLSGRRNLKKAYSYITLHFMCEFAVNYPTPLSFDRAFLEQKYPISTSPDDLLGFMKIRLHSYVFDNHEPLKFKYYSQLQDALKNNKITPSAFNKELEEQKRIRVLRNNYLHWSATFNGIGEPFQPNIEDQQRKRIPYVG
ncbi:T6SS phospholipase effector Tle1-like catalytic domain-containing protein [Pedobacter cryoconitis]|uniref:T6SS Phospholipase effector Tle1-like catalytic domain-containing protein n=1 Tax=Pedobacter cryoconitis TaxID=188932 RepID=A0A7X0J0A3_9SPHI|nr:DUF2235 domain-containing protein [Pedobacter cryoconitis]MBB6498443.1 hypothetical protein [Pedobacter cryoconitis]